MTFRYTLLDVFTDVPLAGNGLAVIHDADALDDATMHRIARETRLSETSFVKTADDPGADYRHSIWMMSGEIPFAGHPSLGTAVAVARARGETRATYVQQTRPGLQPVDVEIDGVRARASMLQEPAAFGPELDAADVMGLVRLEGADADPTHPPQVVSTGVPQVLAFVSEREALERAWPDYDAIGSLLAAHGAIVLYVAWLGDEGVVRARSFTGSAEEGEDPATGSAAGPLCACLAERGGPTALEIVQGVEMGRPSRLHAALEDGRVRVGGDAVVLVDGTLHLDG
ncbi:MAG: Phenazine biosynthesis protein PhzF like [uncultured Solirubrobacteraceae bacterium]|uniref:Phenazine biosynthesis protein PhzF like n=1 Tax=uncultured Solirubrobacteraceae bacterium TaxID=1162706 RepID=A0A6J4SLY4_9ACTN|nr:MAG: Phenazine biosynthesis protein PhzF like [uncultured Solirubrobacteraceae bacterium]